MSELPFRHKYVIASAVALVGIMSYLLVGYASVGDARTIHPGVVDLWVPLLPWTVWVYVPVYVLVFHIGIHFIATRDTLKRTIVSLAISWVVAYTVFMLWPVNGPRVPVADGDEWTRRLMRLLQTVDPPNNTFPSLHVSNLLCVALGCCRDAPAGGLLVLAVSVLPMLSTLTTKQHYFVDVVSGVVLASACHLLAFSVNRHPASQAAMPRSRALPPVDEISS